ncbi:MAG: photosynthetic complex assembly protein PuhC [Pseudomonadota bacterium]
MLQPAQKISENRHNLPLYGILAVMVLCVLLVVASVLTGTGKVRGSIGIPVVERSITFHSDAQGGFRVVDADTSQDIKRFAKGEGAFIRSSIRSMSLNRRAHRIQHDLPYRLAKTEQGRLSLIDPETGQFITVNAFGPVAARSYASLLPSQTKKEG